MDRKHDTQKQMKGPVHGTCSIPIARAYLTAVTTTAGSTANSSLPRRSCCAHAQVRVQIDMGMTGGQTVKFRDIDRIKSHIALLLCRISMADQLQEKW